MSLPEIAPYLVTDENPATSNSAAIDWTRCAALHNYILAFGIQNSGRELMADNQRSWWEYYGDAAERLSGHLSPSLTEFLKHAQIGPQGSFENEHNFFYYVNGLTPPSALWVNHGSGSGEIGGSVITLYSANNIASHPDGLNFDQDGHDAILQMSILDGIITTNGRQSWYPLETILSIWISMIHSSKFQALPPETHTSFSGSGGTKPWVVVPFSQQQLLHTLSAWDQYIQMIEARIPSSAAETSAILIEGSILDSLNIPHNSFAYQFLTQAKRPSFKFIAPGLSIPPNSMSFVTSQPLRASFQIQTPAQDTDMNTSTPELPPILVFYGNGTTPPPPDGNPNGNTPPFSYPYDTIPLPTGLYLNPTFSTSNPFHDTVSLLLPFFLGTASFVRTSDNELLGQKRESRGINNNGGSFSELYQPGYRFFAEGYGVRLILVIESWAQMIEEGDWVVGEEGVLGGMKEWRKADTEEHSWKFMIGVDRIMAATPTRSMFSRQRTPLFLFAFMAGSGVFFALKWKAVMQRSEAAKKASTQGVNFAVVPGRSGGGI
ncbi:hypothetical protein B7463_g9371, partial [Scytalidium lignicola]